MAEPVGWGREARPLPPPGWYPDPSGVAEHRYWDGRAWAAGVASRGRVWEHPLPPAPATPDVRAEERAAMPPRAALIGLAGFGAGLGGAIVLTVAVLVLGLPDVMVLVVNAAALWSGLLWACRHASRKYGTGSVVRDFRLEFRASDLGWGALMSLAARAAGAIAILPFLLGPPSLVSDDAGILGEFEGDALSFAVVAVIAIVGAPIVEELFFRGLVQSALTGWIGTAGAITVQAVLFGLAHASPILGLANFSVVSVIAAAGVVFGVTAWWRRRVTTSIIAHSLFNVVGVVVALAVA